MEFRLVSGAECEAAIALELAGYPEDEAASLESLQYRQKNVSDRKHTCVRICHGSTPLRPPNVHRRHRRLPFFSFEHCIHEPSSRRGICLSGRLMAANFAGIFAAHGAVIRC